MKPVKGYNKIQTQNKLFGLEFFDLLVLLLVYLVVFVFSSNLIVNLLLVVTAYFLLRIYKRGKAPHWSGSVIRFLLKPGRRPVKREPERDVFER